MMFKIELLDQLPIHGLNHLPISGDEPLDCLWLLLMLVFTT